MKTQEQLLKAYKKANKVRRERIAAKAGFNTGDEYKAHLEAQIAGKPANTPSGEDVKIHNVHILDCSGSMHGGKIRSAVQGINQEIKQLQNDDTVDYVQTYIPFGGWGSSAGIHPQFFGKPILQVKQVSASASGGTPLYQAIGETLDTLIRNKDTNEKVLVKIFTDGGENTSRGRYKDPSILKAKIDEAKEKDITVTFVGTEWDVARIINRLEIDKSNTLTHDNTERGVQDSFMATAQATKTYATRALAGEDTLVGFYKQQGTL